MPATFVHVSNAKEGTSALDEWYRKYADKEMKT